VRLILVNGSYQKIDGMDFIFIFTNSESKFLKKKKKKKNFRKFLFWRIDSRSYYTFFLFLKNFRVTHAFCMAASQFTRTHPIGGVTH
jgi:hypothetical protein